MNMRIALVALATALALAGCATITKGTSQIVVVNTPGVSGATCTLTSSAVGSKVVVTPGTISLEKGQDAVSVRCTKECYADGAGIIASNLEGMTAGNVLLGGVIGLGVDAASGAMNKYSSEVQIIMTPIQGCRPAGAPPPAASPPPRRGAPKPKK
jgi:hypothetical protein